MNMLTRNSRNWVSRKSRGAITIFEIIPFILLIWGIVLGAKFGSRFGYFGEWICGVAGGIVGLFSWWLLVFVLSKWLDRYLNLSNRTIEELRKRLNDPNCEEPKRVLLELGIKGEKMETYLPVILKLMTSPLMGMRHRGWDTLGTVFPEKAKMIPDYRFTESVEKCSEKVQKLAP